MKTTQTYFSILIICFATLYNCNTTKHIKNKEPILTGEITLPEIKQDEYSKWYTKNYESYKLNTKCIDELKTIIKDYTLEIYLGTWCGDSQRQVPRLIRILDAINFNTTSNLKLFGLDKEKKSPKKVELDKNINYVPTIIILRNGKEVNRIVEIPVESLEQDLLKILKSNEYKHVYFD